MLSRIDLRGRRDSWQEMLPPRENFNNASIEVVKQIIEKVKTEGDTALREFTKKLDNAEISDFLVNKEKISEAYELSSDLFKAALKESASAIISHHEKHLPEGKVTNDRGLEVRSVHKPVLRAGCYVPGGKAAYPSTVLMTGLVARVAGVEQVVVCVPPNADGAISQETLAAAHVAQVDSVFSVGGAQAIAALAYGTDSIPAVDVIVGPGNSYVALAKQEVAGVVGIPSAFAGPSEIAIIADATATPEFVAIDLAVQAEHGPGGKSILVTTDEDFAEKVENELNSLLEKASRAEEIRSTLESGGFCLLVENLKEAVDVVDILSPEHLQIIVDDPLILANEVKNAAAIFCGEWTPASLGDYVAGPSHVLPTAGTARFAGALTTNDFMRDVHIISSTREALERLGPHVVNFALAEGLDSHANSILLRGIDV